LGSLRRRLAEKKYFFVFCAILAVVGGIVALGIALDDSLPPGHGSEVRTGPPSDPSARRSHEGSTRTALRRLSPTD
jgi:hypothetical protein